MDAPSNGWEPIDPGMATSAAARNASQKPAKTKRHHRPSVPAEQPYSGASFPLTGGPPPQAYGQPIHPNPAAMPYGQPPAGYGLRKINTVSEFEL
ncbi:hypothetical protein BV898_15765 [Hypsibius exemplaris]|uniref:Uncharacterized protein n=1 Tax=Hypsibius exemplaris TaxID=2072580 RepID=A0A9X6RKI9_HYPEX|nr:hypothetical protein BV898_15765 [Hypsibius exemplaris]